MRNCFMVNTLRRYTGIQIKSVCIYSDFVCFSINFFKHACRHPEKCLCVVKRNFSNVWTSIIWVRSPGQTNHKSYLSSFPPCRAPACGSRPRAWLCHPPCRSPRSCPHSDVSLVSPPSLSGLWRPDNGILTWSLPAAWAAQDIKISLLTSALLPAAGHGIRLDKHYSFKVQFTFMELSNMVTFSLDSVAAFVIC